MSWSPCEHIIPLNSSQEKQGDCDDIDLPAEFVGKPRGARPTGNAH
jgi:hypothetical protein